MTRSAPMAACGLFLLATAACGSPDRTNPPTDSAPVVATSPAAPVPADTVVRWQLGPHGIGPVTIGMPLAELVAAIGASPVTIDPAEQQCSYVRGPGAPSGVAFMISDGLVARIDVNEDVVRTPEGAGIGTTEAELRASYAGRIVERPHKYTDGRYLIVSSSGPDSATHKIVFESDGNRVTKLRSGKLPQVEWVEGCA